jgi:hypothetical protein
MVQQVVLSMLCCLKSIACRRVNELQSSAKEKKITACHFYLLTSAKIAEQCLYFSLRISL